MIASEAGDNRRGCADLARQNPDWLLGEIRRLTEGPTLFAPRHHAVLPADVNLAHLEKVLILAHENHPKDFEALLGTRQVGPATVRSLSLLAEIIHNAPPSRREPTETAQRKWATYSYAHGGKDGHPFPVDRTTYDQNARILLDAVRKARLGESEKADALKRLAHVWQE
jgi:hypothetical protein